MLIILLLLLSKIIILLHEILNQSLLRFLTFFQLANLILYRLYLLAKKLHVLLILLELEQSIHLLGLFVRLIVLIFSHSQYFQNLATNNYSIINSRSP